MVSLTENTVRVQFYTTSKELSSHNLQNDLNAPLTKVELASLAANTNFGKLVFK